jgi:hypothetical protein
LAQSVVGVGEKKDGTAARKSSHESLRRWIIRVHNWSCVCGCVRIKIPFNP